MTVRVRYAPSPTGSPHVGNLRTAIYNWLFARHANGRFIARLEDTDRSSERYYPEGIWDIEESLRYLGTVPDEWWVAGGPTGPYVQSERLPIYQTHAERLIEMGAAYRCFCSRERLEAVRKLSEVRRLVLKSAPEAVRAAVAPLPDGTGDPRYRDMAVNSAEAAACIAAAADAAMERLTTTPPLDRSLPALVEYGDYLDVQGRFDAASALRRLAEVLAEPIPVGYDRHCRRISLAERSELEASGQPSVVRLAMPETGVTCVDDMLRGAIEYDNSAQDDQVLLKSDGYPTYFLACPVDDHLMGITHVIRGDDWLSSAAKWVQVFRALDYEVPLLVHVPLIVGADKKKLGKRHGSTQFVEFVQEGYLPEALLNFLVLLGWSTGEDNRELLSISEMVERFTLEAISEHPAVFDYDKLKWMNGQYIRLSEPGRIAGMCLPYLQRAGLIGDPVSREEIEYARTVISLQIERMHVLSEITDLAGYFFKELQFPADYEERAVRKWLSADHVAAQLEREIAVYGTLPDWTVCALEAATREVAQDQGLEFSQVVHPTRVAATGRTVGAGLFETLCTLGRDRTLRRLANVRAALDADASTGEHAGRGVAVRSTVGDAPLADGTGTRD